MFYSVNRVLDQWQFLFLFYSAFPTASQFAYRIHTLCWSISDHKINYFSVGVCLCINILKRGFVSVCVCVCVCACSRAHAWHEICQNVTLWIKIVIIVIGLVPFGATGNAKWIVLQILAPKYLLSDTWQVKLKSYVSLSHPSNPSPQTHSRSV